MRKRRGSAYIFGVVMIAAATTVLLSLSQLAASARQMQRKAEIAYKARLAFDGTTNVMVSDAKIVPVMVNTFKSTNFNGTTTNASAMNNEVAMSKSLSVTGTTIADGQSYRFSTIVGQRSDRRPFHFALYVSDPLVPSQPVITGENGAEGDVYSLGGIVLVGAGHSIGGDLESRGTITAPGVPTAGITLANSVTLGFPSVNFWEYWNARTWTNTGDTTFNGVTFVGINPCYYVFNGDIRINGTIAGKGVIFTRGNVRVRGNMSYASATDAICIVAEGDIVVDSSVTNLVGYFYAGGTMQFDGNKTTVTVSRGSIVCKSLTAPKCTVKVVHDPLIDTTPSVATTLKLPGYWP
jgi:hypothetical protein